jgi:drug/metabolite transporter (DMT)-like permease
MTNNSKTKHIVIIYLKLIASIIIWGEMFHIGQDLVAVVSPIQLSFWRYFFASIILSICLLNKRNQATSLAVIRRHILPLFILGLFGFCFYNITFFSSELYLPSTTVSIFFASVPCFSILIAALVFKKRLKVITLVGIIIGLIGTVGLIISNNHTITHNSVHFVSTQDVIKGQIYAFIMVVCSVLYNITVKFLDKDHIDSLSVTTYSSIFGTIGLLVILVVTKKPIWINCSHLPVTFWFNFIYTVVLSSALAYFWYNQAIKAIGVFKAPIYQNLIPLSAVIIGMLFYHKEVGYITLIFGAIIIVGAIIATKTKS